MKVVEVFAEVGCPFAYVGLTRFVQRRHELGLDAPVLHVRAWPLEVVNGTPLDPPFIADEVDELRRQVAPDLFTGFATEAFPATSLPAMRLTAAAYQADLPTGERVAMAVRQAVFEQGRDVTDAAVLADVAGTAGAAGVDVPGDDAAVLADLDRGRARGVVGSPHFFLPDGDVFCPALDISRPDGHLRIIADQEGFAAFLDRCFA